MDPITKAYLKIINESAKDGAVDETKASVKKPFGDRTGETEKNTHNFVDDSAEEKVEKELETPEEAPKHLSSDTSESEPKKAKEKSGLSISGESKNPFDALFNKIISENTFDFSTEAGNELAPDSDFGGPEGVGHESEGEDHGFEHLEDEEEEDTEEETLESLLSQVKDLVSKIEDKINASEESEEEEESEEGSEEESEEGSDDEEELNEEEVDAEVLGHALVDQEKLEGGLTKKGTHTVKGAVPVTKKSAQIVKGKKVDGKPEAFENKAGIEHLQKQASRNVGGVKAGKFAVEDQS
jgi:hypothetical protein